MLQSGIYIPGNGKSLVKLRGPKGRYMLAASQNRGRLKVFALHPAIKTIPLEPDDVHAEVLYKNGKKQTQEFYNGCSFLSQSSRFVSLGKGSLSVSITDARGRIRKIGL